MALRWLNPTEERAWRGFRRMFTLLEGQLARELTDESGLSMADYTVLSNLVEAEGRRWRITELADHMQWSQSRLSHQIRRMETRGLVQRDDVSDDGRGTVVVLTRDGTRAIAAAALGHFRSVRMHMIDLLTDEQLQTLGDISDIVVSHLTSLNGATTEVRADGFEVAPSGG
ncbi:MAG TPA: MarR family winged helix-turn-helix transcriptional regulator [Jiangellaceae bacterium]